MSDYLTRMVRLSRGEATVVTPRLPSLFAPTEDVGLIETIETTSIQQQSKIENETNTTQTPPAAAVDAGTPQSTIAAELSATEPLRPDATTGQADKSGHGPKPLVIRQHTPLVAGQHSDHAVPIPVAALTLNNNQADSSATQTETNRKPLLTDMLQALVPSKGEIGVDAAGAPTGQPESAKSDSPPPLVPGYTNHQTASQLLIAGLPTAEPAVARKGTVHINIGRVEVRAQAAAPPPLPRPARPGQESAFTLSEYLKRSGGRS